MIFPIFSLRFSGEALLSKVQYSDAGNFHEVKVIHRGMIRIRMKNITFGGKILTSYSFQNSIMKQLFSPFLVAILFCGLSVPGFSQISFPEKTGMANIGIGLGNIYYNGIRGLSGYQFNSSPAISFSYDYGVKNERVIQGTIGLGGIIGYEGSTLKYIDGSGFFYNEHWSNIVIAPRATYHAGFLKTNNADLYAGLMLGLRIEGYSFESNTTVYNGYRGNYGGVSITEGIFVGGAYYFTHHIGVFGEIGYDISYLKIGLSIKTGWQ
jgi:hypothetical protein